MTVLLVRHVEAGDRDGWTAEDRLRPVSDHGRVQADALVPLLVPFAPTAILSSPYVRCVQSVEPLGEALGLDVEHEDHLAEGAPFDLVQRLLKRVSGDGTVVLCSHGDVIGAVVTDLLHRGALEDQPARWPKGSTWVIEGLPDQPRSRYLPPPA